MVVHWADVSSYQPVVTDAYPHPVLAIRSNDGTYRDPKFAANYAWAVQALDAGRLAALIVYCVYRPNWQQTADTMISMVGTPHPKVVAMIDVESWGGQIQGNQSDAINRLYARLVDWLGDPRRVIGYGNRGDLVSLWPMKPPGVALVVAAYGGSVPTYPGMIAHQHGDNVVCDPFGPCDGNTAYDHDVQSLTTALGISGGASAGIRMEEGDDMYNIPIQGIGRRVLGCPTGDLAANKRQAWLSAIVLDLPQGKPAWVQVYAQGGAAGVGEWRWTEKDLAAHPDNYLPRAWRDVPPNTSHLIVSWDISAAPDGGTLLLETRPTV